MALTANISRDTKRHPEPFRASDFLPKWDEPELPALTDAAAQLRNVWGLMPKAARA